MKITILTSSEGHPVNSWLKNWIKKNKDRSEINLVNSTSELIGGDILFLISCSELVCQGDRDKFTKTLVIHASDLPKGRGWSPYIWDIIQGENEIILSLIEAEDQVDSGKVWTKLSINIPLDALYYEINNLLFKAEISLMDFAVENFKKIVPYEQDKTIDPTYYPKRTPKNSELDVEKTINEQFNLMRICDPKRYPAFFYKEGRKFILRLEAVDD